jgi:hypothetical protein
MPCGCPVVNVVHVPTDPETSHALHCSVHAAPQQKPSAQYPLVHKAHVPFEQPEGQVCPFGAFAWHVPFAPPIPLQNCPVVHCESLVQLPTQAVVPHAYGLHGVITAFGQVPRLQLAAAVC